MKWSKRNNYLVELAQNDLNYQMNKRVRLTKREREVLLLVTKGLTAQEIAEEVFLSLHTVETHKRNIMLKLKAKNTAHAVAKAMRMGMIN